MSSRNIMCKVCTAHNFVIMCMRSTLCWLSYLYSSNKPCFFPKWLCSIFYKYVVWPSLTLWGPLVTIWRNIQAKEERKRGEREGEKKEGRKGGRKVIAFINWKGQDGNLPWWTAGHAVQIRKLSHGPCLLPSPSPSFYTHPPFSLFSLFLLPPTPLLHIPHCAGGFSLCGLSPW